MAFLLLFMCREFAMADGFCVSNGAASLDFVRDKKQRVEAGSLCKLACVLCGTAAAAASRHLKMLPCLHVTCEQCLVKFLLDKSLPHKDASFAASIFACPCCSFTIQLPCDGVSGLKDASFLQTAASSVMMPDAAVTRLSDGEGCRCASMPLLTHAVSSGTVDDGDVKDAALLLANLSQTLSETDIHHFPKCTGSSKLNAEMLHVSSVNSEERSDGDTLGRLQLDDTVDLMTSQISHLLLDASVRRQQSDQTIQQIKLATHDLDARKAELHRTISQRADSLCQLICSRRDQLFNEVDREHSQSSALHTERIGTLTAYSRSIEDSSLFAGAVLAAKDVSVEVEVDVVVRLKQLILCDKPGVWGPCDMPEITAMRLDIPDAQHEEAYMEKLFGSIVNGTVGTIEFLNSFNTELQWPTGFVVTRTHDSVLAGKAGAFAEEGQALFFDCHGTCVHRHALPAGHLPVDVVTVGSGDVLVSDVSGCVTKFSSSGCLLEEWNDVFRGPSGHMAVNGSDEVLITSASEYCIHRYHDGQRLASFSLQWPDSGLHVLPDVTAIAINSHNEMIVTASNFSSAYFFSADGQFLRSCSVEPTVDRGVGTHMQNGVKSASVTLLSAACCDSFDNVLIADFVGNCVHLVSRSGHHLGRLLTNKHGVACPNFVTLDQDGRLYVGQYGGDVLLFRYLSYIKHV